MNIKEYIELSKTTNSKAFHIGPEDEKYQQLLHGAIGICTEAGELLDALKKKVYYGSDLDLVNMKEELGDMMWYVAIILRELDLDLEDVLETNINKLKTRYGEKFSKENAENRDLEKEREVLEKETNNKKTTRYK